MFVSICDLIRQSPPVLVSAAAVALAFLSPAAAQTLKPAATHVQAHKAIEWPDYAGGPEGNRYMPLDQITKENVTKLDVAWSYPHAETGFNPIVAHGLIYTKARNK